MPRKPVVDTLIDRERLNAALREFDGVGPNTLAEWAYFYIAPAGSQLFSVDTPYRHTFTQLFDGSLLDVAADDAVNYHDAKPVDIVDPPSQRVRELHRAYGGDPDEWRVPVPARQHAAALLKGWRDPYPAPRIFVYDTQRLSVNPTTALVVRDDMLRCGSKARFVDALVSAHPEIDEWVFGSCPAQGWAQISLTEVCNRHNKQAHYFMAQRNPANYTAEQKTGLALGGHYHWVANGMLPVTQARAREYVAEQPDSRMVLPIGLEHELVTAAIIDVAATNFTSSPAEVWSVASSGTLSRGLQVAFPAATVHAVSVGHTMSAREIGRAKLWRSPLKFERNIADDDKPPYPSVSNYDAKVWPFVREYGDDYAWVWNVAADLVVADERIAV